MPPHRPGPLLLGHRGSPHRHRENTLESFEAALAAGLDGIELDVRRLADGTLVVHHDERLFDGRPLAALTFPALRPHPVPTLADALALIADAGAAVNVEIKYEAVRADDRVPNTADLVRRFGLAARCVVSSFNPLVLSALRDVAPELERGFLFDRNLRAGPLDVMLGVARRLDVAAIHPRFPLVTPALMAAARRAGWRVNVWTVNDEATARRLLELGADGLIGDLPDVLLRAADRALAPG